MLVCIVGTMALLFVVCDCFVFWRLFVLVEDLRSTLFFAFCFGGV